MHLTPYQDINEFLEKFLAGISDIFRENLIGLYLTGSLSYCDFSLDSSDIDLAVVLHNPCSHVALSKLEKLHSELEKIYTKWTKRIECTYLHKHMLSEKNPPKYHRLYYNEGIFYTKAPYGYEWLINQYLLWNYSIPIFGQPFKTLTHQIDITDVQNACMEDLLQEWQQKVANKTYLKSSHCQNLTRFCKCAVFYTLSFMVKSVQKMKLQHG